LPPRLISGAYQSSPVDQSFCHPGCRAHEADHSFGIADFTFRSLTRRLGQRYPVHLDHLVLLGVGLALYQVAREVQVDDFVEHARRGEDAAQRLPLAGLAAGFFQQLAPGGAFRRFAGRYWRSRQTLADPSTATTAAPPGWRTIS
jgi:hypothetical protein